MAQAQDAVWLPVLPSMKGFGPALVKGAGADAEKSGKDIGVKFGKAMIAGTAVVGAAAVGAGVALYKVGEVFNDVKETIRVGAGASGEALDGLVDVAKRVGTKVPASFEDIGSVVADVNTRMGLSGETLEKVASQYLEAGRILGEEVDVMKTGAAFNAFKIEGEDVSGALDHLFQVSQATGIGMNELADGAQKNAPAMQTLGFSFEETTAMIGSFDKAGLNSSALMASMSKGMITLAKDGEEPAEAFKRVQGEIAGFIDKGDEAGALNLASKVFGTKGASQFVGALKNGTLNLEDMSKAAGQTGDTILGAGAETMDFAEQWMMFKNKILVWLEPAATAVFGAIGDLMGEITGGVTAFGAAWNNNDGDITSSGIPGMMERLGYYARQTFDYFKETVIPNMQQFGDWIVKNKDWLGALAVGVGAVAGAFYLWIGAVKLWQAVTKIAIGVQAAFNLVMSLNPIGLIILAIVGLVAGLAYFFTQTDLGKDIVKNAFAVIQGAVAAVVAWWNGTFIPAIKSIGTWFKSVFEGAQTVVTNVFNFIKTVISVWWAGVNIIFTAVTSFIRDVFVGAFNFLRDSVSNVFNGIKDTISNVWENGIKPVFNFLKDAVTKTIPEAFQKGVDGVKKIWDTILDIAKKPVRFVVDTVINDGLIGTFNKVAAFLPGIKGLDRVALPNGFRNGGYTGNYGVDTVAGVVHGNEHVIRAESRKSIEGRAPGFLDALNKMGAAALAGFGYRKGGRVNPTKNMGLTQGYNASHDGIDIGVPVGTPVFATGDGVVTHAGPGARAPGVWGGNEIHVKGDGIERWFAHLSQIGVKVGQMVSAGQQIGASGNTGISSGPHLHFGTYSGGWPNSMNPLSYLAGASAPSGGGFNPFKVITDLAGGVMKKVMSALPGGGFMVDVAAGIGKKLITDVGSWAKDKLGLGAVAGSSRGGHLDPLLYDQGGVLRPGLSSIYNATGKPEYILNPQQWADISKLATDNTKGGKGMTYSPTYQWAGDDPNAVMDRDKARMRDTFAVYV